VGQSNSRGETARECSPVLGPGPELGLDSLDDLLRVVAVGQLRVLSIAAPARLPNIAIVIRVAVIGLFPRGEIQVEYRSPRVVCVTEYKPVMALAVSSARFLQGLHHNIVWVP
jgi:hypothetical protein